MPIESKRNNGIDLYRCLCMFLVIGFHYADKGSIMLIDSNITLNWCLLAFLKCFGAICNCAFMLCSGYYLYGKKIKSIKICKLWSEVVFYSVFSYVISCIVVQKKIEVLKILMCFIPITTNKYWFFSSYILVYLLAPYMNKLIMNLTRQQHESLSILLLFVFSFLYTFMRIKWLAGPNSLLIFFSLYVVGTYLKRWNLIIRIKKLFIVGVFALEFLSIISISKIPNGSHYMTYFVWDSAKFFPVVISIGLFIFFLNYGNLHTRKNIVLQICSPSLFGIYLLHTGDLSTFIFKDLFNNSGVYYGDFMFLHMLFSMASVFIFGVIIDKIRIVLLEKYIFNSKLELFFGRLDNELYSKGISC